MENLPIEKGIGLLKWWTGLKPTDKLLAFLVACIIAVSTIGIKMYGNNVTLQKEKSILEKENLNYAKECEARAAVVAISERNRSDSVVASVRIKYEVELQRLFISRTSEIKQKNEKIKTVLK